MAVDRLIYLAKPLTYDFIVTPLRMALVVVVEWIIKIAFGLLLLFEVGEVGYTLFLNSCSIYAFRCINGSIKFYTSFIVIVSLDAFYTLAQLVCCGCIIHITRCHLREKLRRALGSIRGSRQTSNNSGAVKKSQWQLVMLFGAIFSISFFRSLPSTLGLYYAIIARDVAFLAHLLPIFYFANLSSAVLHPILESYMTPKFWLGYKRTFSCNKN